VALAVLVPLLSSPPTEPAPRLAAAEQPPAAAPSQPKPAAGAARAARPRRRARLAPIRIQADLALANQTRSEFREPGELAFKRFNDLRLTTGTFDSENAAGVGVPKRLELLCYNGRPVGPTIRVRRGTTFHVRVKNDLDLSGKTPVGPADPDRTPPNAKALKPMDLCLTNLHTHGLHVSPEGHADNIFRSIAPGEEFTFEYTIGADHPAGTFWYHPHLHGSVAYQLSNGLAGALIVEGSPHDGAHDLDKIPAIARARERVLVFQLYNYVIKPNETTARIDANSIYNVTPDAYSCEAISVDEKDKPLLAQATAISGVINPIIRLVPGEVQRWRLIHAGWDVDRRLALADDRGKPATDLNFYEIALDGLATGKVEEKSNVLADDGSNVEIAPGQRSDVLIKAPLLPKGSGPRTYLLVQDPADADTPKPHYLAKIIVSGEPRPMSLPTDLKAVAACRPFDTIRDGELSKDHLSPIATSGLVFRADDDTGTPEKPNRKPFYTINDKTFNDYFDPADLQAHSPYPHPTVPVRIRLDTAEEWTISADRSDHPFHIHVNPFQVVKHNGQALEEGKKVWRDTLFVRQGEAYTIRSRFRDFLGLTVLHCHILDHEDQGMMVPIEFIRPDQDPGAPAPPVKKEKLRPASAPAPALTLPDGGGASHSLREFRRRAVVLVFFQGVECRHCAEKLRDLVRDARGPGGPGAAIVAVSGRRVADPARALAALGVSASDKFQLLVDESHQAFRDFGCYEGGPLHGLFLIDGDGVIRASYTGESPFGDTREAVRQARALLPFDGQPAQR
jgi:FtsP/CotA-like multicopper oxidase with cupredoxin domain/peroxiredoxin